MRFNIRFNIILEYTIKLGENVLSDTHGDIVVAHAQGKLDGPNPINDQAGGNTETQNESSDAITSAFAVMAGTAIIFL